MMKLIFRPAFVLLASIMVLVFTSCKHEGEYDHADITVTYSCTKDILTYFTPVAYITNTDGTKREITLIQKDFYEDRRDSIFVFDTSSPVDVQVFSCSITDQLKGIRGTYSLTIEYIPRKDHNSDNIENYCFADGISSGVVEVICNDGHLIKKQPWKYTNNFQYIHNPENFTTMLHLYSHKSLLFDITYEITTIDDEIIFDSKIGVSIGTHDNVLTQPVF